MFIVDLLRQNIRKTMREQKAGIGHDACPPVLLNLVELRIM